MELSNVVVGDLPVEGFGCFYLEIEYGKYPEIVSSVQEDKDPRVVHFPEAGVYIYIHIAYTNSYSIHAFIYYIYVCIYLYIPMPKGFGAARCSRCASARAP